MPYQLWPPYGSPYTEFYDDKGRKEELYKKIREINARLFVLDRENLDSDEMLLQNILGFEYGIVKIIPGIEEDNIHPIGDCTAVVSIDGHENVELQVSEQFLDGYLETVRKFCKAKLIDEKYHIEDQAQNCYKEIK